MEYTRLQNVPTPRDVVHLFNASIPFSCGFPSALFNEPNGCFAFRSNQPMKDLFEPYSAPALDGGNRKRLGFSKTRHFNVGPDDCKFLKKGVENVCKVNIHKHGCEAIRKMCGSLTSTDPDFDSYGVVTVIILNEGWTDKLEQFRDTASKKGPKYYDNMDHTYNGEGPKYYDNMDHTYNDRELSNTSEHGQESEQNCELFGDTFSQVKEEEDVYSAASLLPSAMSGIKEEPADTFAEVRAESFPTNVRECSPEKLLELPSSKVVDTAVQTILSMLEVKKLIAELSILSSSPIEENIGHHLYANLLLITSEKYLSGQIALMDKRWKVIEVDENLFCVITPSEAFRVSATCQCGIPLCCHQCLVLSTMAIRDDYINSIIDTTTTQQMEMMRNFGVTSCPMCGTCLKQAPESSSDSPSDASTSTPPMNVCKSPNRGINENEASPVVKRKSEIEVMENQEEQDEEPSRKRKRN